MSVTAVTPEHPGGDSASAFAAESINLPLRAGFDARRHSIVRGNRRYAVDFYQQIFSWWERHLGPGSHPVVDPNTNNPEVLYPPP